MNEKIVNLICKLFARKKNSNVVTVSDVLISSLSYFVVIALTALASSFAGYIICFEFDHYVLYNTLSWDVFVFNSVYEMSVIYSFMNVVIGFICVVLAAVIATTLTLFFKYIFDFKIVSCKLKGDKHD